MALEQLPRFSAGVRLRYDRRTGRHLLLSPERGLLLNDSAAAVARRCDGGRRVSQIVAELVQEGAPPHQARTDTCEILSRWARRGLVRFGGAAVSLPAESEDGARASEDGAARVESLPAEARADEDHDAPRPFTLVAELTYSCPLRCAYCSNPVSVAQRAPELGAADWQRVLHEAEALGVVHVHFSGGEPLLHPALEALVATAREADLYVNLITSGVPLTRPRLLALRDAGLEHVQLSFQAATPELGRRVAGLAALEQKLAVGRWAGELGLALTVNVVLHRQNAHELPELLALAESLAPSRIEIANAQFLGWALVNRAALLLSDAQLEQARRLVADARRRLRGVSDVLFVLPDYHAGRPRACMQGWAKRYLVVTPDGLLLPCQAARDLDGVSFDDVRAAPLARLWLESPALQRFRGQAWLPEPCRSCDERERDFGGCRCQAFRLLGDAGAADPACSLTPAHELVLAARRGAARPLGGERLELRRPPRAVRA